MLYNYGVSAVRHLPAQNNTNNNNNNDSQNNTGDQNGGDQNNSICIESKVCKKLGIKLIDGLGSKIQSSSWLLK